ncbi:PLP-dependent transferase [Mycena filopes]|nr:PLP-dependent transferase [Mycena filopes]
MYATPPGSHFSSSAPSAPSYCSSTAHSYTHDRDRDRERDPGGRVDIERDLVYSASVTVTHDAATAYKAFLASYPAYKLTWILDTLRRTDYARLSSSSGVEFNEQGGGEGETYVDYMGGALYPESLVRVHAEFLTRGVLGNTHSVSNSSKLSASHATAARLAVLSFFNALPSSSPDSDYTVIFTPNASAALKLIGESFPFTPESSCILPCDAHNSVHGVREFARRRGAEVVYVPTAAGAAGRGGVDVQVVKEILQTHAPPTGTESLFVMTAQSNITNTKSPLALLAQASALGCHTLLDAAALAPTSVIDLSSADGINVDAMAVSFYKMFGFPTGVGALIAKKSFLAKLERPWFAGGTVDVVQVPGTIVTRAEEIHEQFEDGTINYLSLPSITSGLHFLSAYLPFLPLRLSSLLHHLATALSALRHDLTCTPVVRILSALPSKKLSRVGEQSDVGSLLALEVLSPSGSKLPNAFIEHAASRQNISLRTGCMCNPGGAAAISLPSLSSISSSSQSLSAAEAMALLYPGVRYADIERTIGADLGVVRISLGLASNFQDVWNVVRFFAGMGHDSTRAGWMAAWRAEGGGMGTGRA